MVECEEEQPRRYKITRLRNIVLVSLSLGLSLVTYLILVVSSAPVWLRLLGVAAVIAMGLWQQIAEELRRQRLDRIVAIITMILLAASLMSLATYANKSLTEGEIYRGKARIIGFDYENYDNNDGDVTRTDLEGKCIYFYCAKEGSSLRAMPHLVKTYHDLSMTLLPKHSRLGRGVGMSHGRRQAMPGICSRRHVRG